VIEPFPSVGRVFAEDRLVGPGDTDTEAHARLDAIVDWLQAVAFADAIDAGLSDAFLWIVRRVALEVERFPRLGERVQVRTACSALGARWAERRTSLPGVEAAALWVAIDPQTLRPARIDALADVYGESAAGRRVKTGLVHPSPPALAGSPWTFRRTDLDAAGHVNNAAYWRVLDDPLPAPVTVEIEHRVPCGAEDVTVVAEGPRRWVVRGDGAVSASFLIQ
jgi:acyl-ACP thioesterase